MQRHIKVIVISTISLLIIGVGITTYFVLQPHQSVSSVVSQPVLSATTKADPPTAAELLKLVNIERAKNGVAPLVEDARLDKSAQRKADDMFKNHYFAHVSPIDGKQGYLYINDVGIYCKTDAENLRRNAFVNTSVAAVNGWISSPEHHMAMIDSDYTLTGFGVSGLYVVEHFCQQ